MISYERQTSFGWLVVIDTFLAGAGGGVFLVGFILNLLGKHESVARIGVIIGPVLAIIGGFFILAELGSRKRAYRVLSNLSSWITRGALFMTIFILSGLAYSLPSLVNPQWTSTGPGQFVGIIAAISSILVSIYPGFLFGVVKAIPFWNTSILPVLFLFLSWLTGIAALLFSAILIPGVMEIVGLHEIGGVLIVLLVVCSVMIGGYLEVVRHGNATARASVAMLKTPLFFYGAGLLGLFAPLVFLVLSVIVKNLQITSLLAGISSVLILLGGILIRYGVLKAGIYQPLR